MDNFNSFHLSILIFFHVLLHWLKAPTKTSGASRHSVLAPVLEKMLI